MGLVPLPIGRAQTRGRPPADAQVDKHVAELEASGRRVAKFSVVSGAARVQRLQQVQRPHRAGPPLTLTPSSATRSADVGAPAARALTRSRRALPRRHARLAHPLLLREARARQLYRDRDAAPRRPALQCVSQPAPCCARARHPHRHSFQTHSSRACSSGSAAVSCRARASRSTLSISTRTRTRGPSSSSWRTPVRLRAMGDGRAHQPGGR